MLSLFCVSSVLIEDGKIKNHSMGLRIASLAEIVEQNERMDFLPEVRKHVSILVHPIVEEVQVDRFI